MPPVGSPTSYNALPAVCDNCGTIFRTPFGVPTGGSNMVVKFDGPAFICPQCFGPGHVPADRVDLSRPDVIAALEAPESPDNLRRLVNVLASAPRAELVCLRTALADSEGRSSQEIAENIEREAPHLRGVADWIRIRDNRMELLGWLALLAAIAGILLTLRPSPQGVTPQQIEQIIHAVAPTAPAQSRPAKPPGRNESCHCGSGRKYKHCHGAPPERPAPNP